MTNQEIERRLKKLVSTERKITNEILKLIRLADERKLFLDLGHSSLFDWLTKGLGYSESAAQRRINSARLLGAVPEVSKKIESGKLNLTTLSRAQSAIRLQEKVTGTKLTQEQKAHVVERIEEKSSVEAEKILVDLFPQAALQVSREKKTEIANDQVRLSVNLSLGTIEDLERIKELLSHVIPHGATFAEVIAHIAREFRTKKDPLEKKMGSSFKALAPEASRSAASSTTAAAAKLCVTAAANKSTRSIPAALRRAVMKRDEGRCTFEDPRTKKRCNSRFQIQIDHVYPKALGGESTEENLRCLCRAHNLHAARLTLGSAHAESWRR